MAKTTTKKNPNPLRGSVWKVWFLFHTGMKTHLQTSETFVEVQFWCLAASARNFAAYRRRGWHVGPSLVQPCHGHPPHAWSLMGISPMCCCSLLSFPACPEASGNAEELPDVFPHLLKCAKWFTKNKKSSFGPRSSHPRKMQYCGSMGNEILSPKKAPDWVYDTVIRSAWESRSQRLEDSARDVLISQQPLSMSLLVQVTLLINTTPQQPACRFVSHPPLLHQQWLGDPWLIGGTWTGRVGGSVTGAPDLFGVGQLVLSILLTLSARLHVCSPFGGKERPTFCHQSRSLTLLCPPATCVRDNFLHLKVLLRPGKAYNRFIHEPHLQANFFSPQPTCWLLSFNRPWNCFP